MREDGPPLFWQRKKESCASVFQEGRKVFGSACGKHIIDTDAKDSDGQGKKQLFDGNARQLLVDASAKDSAQQAARHGNEQ